MKINLLILENKPILEQLKIEEGLLRTNHQNWMIINIGSPDAIVMGLSSKPDEWVDLLLAKKASIPIIQRFSGGGTVFVDQETLFTSFIINKDAVAIEAFPRPILNWTMEFYKKALGIENLQLRENDYTIGNLKVGGNAQYLTKNRWLHHTTFLHDFKVENMNFLLHPKRQPEYRKNRPHKDFITTLAPHVGKKEFVTKIVQQLRSEFEVHTVELPITFSEYRTSILVH